MEYGRPRIWLLLLIAMLVASISIAACGQNADDDDAAPSPEGGAAATETPTEQPEESPDEEQAPTPTATEEEAPTPEGPGSTPTTEAAADFPVTVTRTDGVDLTIEQRPERIVSLSPGATDTFFAIGAGEQLVAVDLFSDYPADTADLPKLDAYQPDPEAVVELEPDLVFVIYDAEGIVGRLEDLGIPVLYLDAPRSIDELIEHVRLFGEVTGNAGEADELATSLEERVAAVTDRLSDVEEGPRIYHELDQELYTVGPGSFIGDLYVTLGAENIADEAPGDYPQLSEEVIIERNPEVIILPVGEGGPLTTPEDVKQRPGWDVIDAVQNDRIYEIDQDIVSRPGPRIVDALEQLAELLYPGEFAGTDEYSVGEDDYRPAA